MVGHQRTSSTGLTRPTPLRSGTTSATSSSRSSSPVKPPLSATSMLSPPGSSPHISRLAPPSSPVKRIPSLTLQPRKSFPRQSTTDTVPASPSLPSTRMTAPPIPAPSSSHPDEASSITVTASRTTVLSTFAPLTSSPQPQLQSLQQSPVPDPASLLPPAQITLSSAAPSLAHRSGHVQAVSITREPSSPITSVCLVFM